jgi:hypothetical protein
MLIEITLPDEIAQRAGRAGLLSDSAIQQLLEEALRRRSGFALMTVARDIREAGLAPMSMEEIEAEVAACRAERIARKPSDRASAASTPADETSGS